MKDKIINTFCAVMATACILGFAVFFAGLAWKLPVQ